ncbi:hypothetical protein [Pseudomonas sp. NBRC 111128]|uniref:hypothetical protein n=1 Tax=Pseudomonas sp. NBRC 111128 TaxID=1661043 RepID=UPI0006D4670E|nr:hypothetical protein [Pseudomonas sp. NBRC 111128]
MSEVHRYKVVKMLSEGGNRISYDPHGPEVVMAEAYDQLKAENEVLRKDAERYRFVRNPIGTSSPLAIWNEGKMPLFSGMADAVVDEYMAKELTNKGHGHVFPRHDGVKAKCGGPGLCAECAADQQAKEASHG